MKQMKWFVLVFMATMGAFTLTSCADDLLAADDTGLSEAFAEVRSDGDDLDADTADAAEEAARQGCFQFVYPLTLVYPDESTVDVTTAEEHKETRKAWVVSVLGEGANPKDLPRDQHLKFAYPIEVTKGESTVVIDSGKEMKRLMKSCGRKGGKGDRGKGPRGKKDCADLVFPLSVTMPDGTVIDATDKGNLHEQVKAWKDANPDAEGRPEFVFPVEVQKRDGTIESAADADELKELMTSCRGPQKDRCFTLVYPVTMIMPDGSTLTGDSAKQIKRQIKAWIKINGRPETRPELQYPVTVTLEDETTQVVNSKEEMEALKESCEASE